MLKVLLNNTVIACQWNNINTFHIMWDNYELVLTSPTKKKKNIHDYKKNFHDCTKESFHCQSMLYSIL